MTDSSHHPLDNPAWHALTTQQKHLAMGGPLALRFQLDVAPFAAIEYPTPEALQKLHALISSSQPVLLQTPVSLPVMENLAVERYGYILQMLAQGEPEPEDDSNITPLGPNDLPDMLALIQRCKPGPFSTRTPEMGQYVGLRQGGQLIAMAGERMRLDGYVEISAVCVDEQYRGQGLARRLINVLRRDIHQRGSLAFLHVLAENSAAIALYEKLGFESRQQFELHKIALC